MKKASVAKRLVGLVAVSALALTAACGGGSDDKKGSASKAPFQLLYVSGITGLLAPSAKAVERGIKAHIDSINAAGGINGRKLELTVGDNQSDPTRGVTIIQKALNGGKKPDLVLPGVSSNEELAVAPLLARNKVVGMGPISTPALDNVKKFPYTFSESMTTIRITAAGIDYIMDRSHPKKIALVVPNDAIGDATVTAFNDALKGKNISTTVARFADDAVDMSPTFQKAVQFHPDWMVMEGAGTQVAGLLTGRVKAAGESIPTLAGVVASSQPLLKLAKGDQLKNVYATNLPTGAYIKPADRGAQFNDFFKRVNAQGSLEVPLSTYATGWDSVGIWANAVKTIKGDVTGEKIKDALETTPRGDDPQFPLYSGNYSKKSHFHLGSKDDFTFGAPIAVKDGMFVIKGQ